MSVGTFKPERLTKTFKPKNRGDYHTQENIDVMKSARAGNLEKKDIASQVADSYTDPRSIDIEDLTVEVAGRVQTLSAAMVERIIRQSTAAMGFDVKSLSVAERQVLADKLVAMLLGDGGALRNPSETAASRQQVQALCESVFLLRPGPNAPMPLRSEGFEPAKAAGGNLRKSASAICPHCHKTNEIDSYGALAGMRRITCAHCSKNWEEDLSESSNLHKSNSTDIRFSNLAAQVDALTVRVTEILKAQTGAQAPATPRFVTRRTGDVQEADLERAAPGEDLGAPGARFTPLRQNARE